MYTPPEAFKPERNFHFNVRGRRVEHHSSSYNSIAATRAGDPRENEEKRERERVQIIEESGRNVPGMNGVGRKRDTHRRKLIVKESERTGEGEK